MTKFYTGVTQRSHAGPVREAGGARDNPPAAALPPGSMLTLVIAVERSTLRTGGVRTGGVRAARVRAVRVRAARRRVTAALVGVAVLGLLTGCDLFAPQDTKYIQETAAGVNGEIGPIFIGDAVLLKAQSSGPTALVTTLVNQGESSEEVRISTDAGSETVTVKAAELLKIGTPDGESVTFDGLDAPPGALADVTFQTSSETETLQVPVLDGSLPQYKNLVP